MKVADERNQVSTDGLVDWDAPAAPYEPARRAALIALIVVPALLVSLVVTVLAGAWWIGALMLVGWAGKTFYDGWTRDPLMLRRLGARPLAEHEGLRLRNISVGMAADLKVPAPDLYVIEGSGPNALVRRGGNGGLLVVTSSLLDGFTRTELEAVVAHCLVRLHSSDFLYSNLAARWSDLGAGLAPQVGERDDVRAVALTRYPPGLASALQKADPGIKRYAPLWFASDAPSHLPTSERIAAVTDL